MRTLRSMCSVCVCVYNVEFLTCASIWHLQAPEATQLWHQGSQFSTRICKFCDKSQGFCLQSYQHTPNHRNAHVFGVSCTLLAAASRSVLRVLSVLCEGHGGPCLLFEWKLRELVDQRKGGHGQAYGGLYRPDKGQLTLTVHPHEYVSRPLWTRWS